MTIEEMSKVLWQEITRVLEQKEFVLVALDGRCAAGKTSLANEMQSTYGCNVVHMDHFFLRPEQRTAERFNEPGGNVDYERFLQEVLQPLKENKAFSYGIFDCHKQKITEYAEIVPKKVTIIEGSYSCHPELIEFYDLKVFLDVDTKEQQQRILKRNGIDGVSVFQNKWIPLEEKYFSAYCVKERSNLCFK